MAITVTPINYNLYSSCNTLVAGGTWSGGNVRTTETDFFKYGTACIAYTVRTSAIYDLDFAPTIAIDLTGSKHVRMWFLSSRLFATQANDGIQIYISDGVDTAYWTVGGYDTYTGGWVSYVVDSASIPTSGTKPADMSTITNIGIRLIAIGTTKNVPTTYIDHLHISDGINVTSTTPISISDIYNEDILTTNAWGIISRVSGVYFLAGSLQLGDNIGILDVEYTSSSSVLVFQDRPVNIDLYNIEVIGNGTGTSIFQIGIKSGTAGIQGDIIRVESVDQLAKFDIIATDTDIDTFKVYGATILDAHTISLPLSGINREVVSSAFESCGTVEVSTCVFNECNIIAPNNTGMTISTTSHNVTNTSFISAGVAIAIDTAGTYTFDNLTFTNSTYDIENSSTGLVTVNAINGADPSSSIDTGIGASTVINNSKTLSLINIIEFSEVRIYLSGTTTEVAGVEDVSGTTFVYTYNYTGDFEVDIVVLKTTYEYYRINAFPLTADNSVIQVQQNIDRVYNNP